MRHIDMKTWKRKKQYEMFKNMEMPYFNICTNVDVREVKSYCKEKQSSFFKTMLYFVSKAVNEIPELRTRIKDDGIVEYSKTNPSFTVLGDDELFGFARAEYTENYEVFYKEVEEELERVKDNVIPDFEVDVDSDFYLTTIPWISFTSIQHPMHIEQKDCIPRIALGKYFEDREKLMMPVSFQAHHGLVDGIHAGKFFMKLEEYLAEPKKYLER